MPRFDPRLPLAPSLTARSFEAFFGANMVSDVFGIDGRDEDHDIFWDTPVDEAPYAILDEGYAIHACNDPDWEPMTVILRHRGEACGFYAGGELWVDADHRGRSLGAEMVLAMVDIAGASPSNVPGGMGFSFSGEAAHRKAWELARSRSIRPTPTTSNDEGEYLVTLTTAQKIAILESYGFTIGERDARLNTNYPGTLMVTEASHHDIGDYELPTADGSNGPWTAVGDDLEELLDHGMNLVCEFDAFDEVRAKFENVADADLPERQFTSLTAEAAPKP